MIFAATNTAVGANSATESAWKMDSSGYYRLIVNPYAKTFDIEAPPTVTKVTITGGNISINKGGSNAFTATVTGYNNHSQNVTWSIVETPAAGTGFGTGEDANTLTIASDETAPTLTVRATSAADAAKYDEITVTVQSAEAPTVASIVVSAAGNVTEILRGNTLLFNKTVTAANGATEDVTWSVSGKDKDGGPLTSIVSSISTSGLLTVDANESAVDLVVRATSKQSGFTTVYGEASVFVRKFGDIYAIGTDFTGGWTVAGGSKMTYVSRGVYTLANVLLTKGGTFKFRDNTPTTWDNGNWFHAGTLNAADSETIGEKWAGVRSSSSADGADNNWVTTHGGKYGITLNTADTGNMTVKFVSDKQVITITGGPSALAPGEEGTFTWTTAVTAPVTWAVYGGGIADGNNPTGTQVSSNGKLTLGITEWAGSTLYVTATSLGETVQSSDYSVLGVPVIDATMNLIGEPNRSGGNWSSTGVSMTRNGATFTWTGIFYDYDGRRDFRLSPSNTETWSKTWIVPSGTNENDNRRAWINSEHLGQYFNTDRLDSQTTERTWFINISNGNYTIVYNAIAKTVTVTRNGD
jgi:hypothetical protein